jgi:hypothetical protein
MAHDPDEGITVDDLAGLPSYEAARAAVGTNGKTASRLVAADLTDLAAAGLLDKGVNA